MKSIQDQATFDNEVLRHPGVVLVDFFTDHCSPCRMMSPVVDELAKERPDVIFVKVNAASNTEVAVQYRVSAVPTFMLFANGQVKGQFTGVRSKEELASWIEANR